PVTGFRCSGSKACCGRTATVARRSGHWQGAAARLTMRAPSPEGCFVTTELCMLLWSVVLGLVQIALAASCSFGQRGLDWIVSARDEVKPPLVGIGGRLDRARANFLETFPLFAAAVL